MSLPEASALLAALPSAATPSVVRAFQSAYNAAGGSPALSVDGVWGSHTEQALLKYGRPSIQGYTPRVKTSPSPAAFAAALAGAWPAIVGSPANLVAIQLLLAQSAYETAQWASCANWNFGNVKHVPGDGYACFVSMDDCRSSSGEPVPCLFRSYPDMATGVREYLSFMATAQRYRAAWPHLLAGDPTAFVAALKAGGYFSGSLDAYTAGVKQYFAKFQAMMPTAAQLKGAAVTGAKVAGVGAGVYVAGGVLFLTGLAVVEWWKNR